MTKKSTSRGFQLSPQQKRIWRLHNEPPDSQVQAIVRIVGPLQKVRLKRAISQQIKHQSILRTNFARLAGMDFPLQVITDEARLAWQEIDLRWLKPEDQQVCMDEIIQAEHSRLFDLEQEPLVRFSLFLLAPLEYVLLISQHALCADAASLSNLASAISQSYAGVSTQPPEEEDIQYVQFAGWQNSLLEEEASSGKAYWTRQQAQILPVKLPFEQPSLSPAPFRSAMLTRKLDAQLIIRLNALAQTSSISLSSFLLAGWLLLLSRLSEQAEITLGYVCDGRKYEELSSLLGTCTTCLPLRKQVDETLSFYQLLTSLDETVHQHEEWLEYFTWETLQGASELHGASYCSVGFACWSQPASWTNGGVTFTLEPLSVYIDRFKVMLVCTFTNEGVLTEFSFDETSLSREGIECLAEQFHTLLESCARSPQSPLAQITQLSEASKQFLLQTLNQTSTALPAEQCIHQIIEAQVILAPDAIAVVYKDEHLTYHTLDKRANHVAHALSQSGVERGMLVGLRVEQSPALVIGMLGILKRGAAYLPLAPEWPDERLRLLAEEAGFIFLLTQQHLAISSPLPRIHQIVLNADESGVTVVSEQASSSQVEPADLAYVIFTSGSTGRPKGVCIEHRNLANYTYAMLERLQLSAPASFALISSYTVDLGNTMIYPALCSGGTLHILPQEWITDTEALAAWCLRRPNDCLKIVPVHLQALLAHPQGKHILPRQRLIFGGDILSWELADRVQALAPACTLLNHYGPTETTVGSLLFPIDPAAPRSTLTVPAGRPLLNTQIYVLDDQYQPVSIGTPGELYIGGMGVGRGYLNRADLTAQAFIPHPFSTDPGMRLYKTGDRVRFQPDGTLEFLGRRDRQVKIRGFRIELEEIEYILQRYPTIEAAAVDVDDAQTKRLLAYLVCPSVPDNKEVQRYLQQYLPEYMFPSAFIQVNELPLLPNGKLDRQGLRTIGRTRQTQHVAPTDRPRKFLEQELVRLWEQTLNVPQIGVHDNFFELGGDSILSIQVVARASQAGISITPKQMISHQTIAELAEVVTVMQTDLVSQDLDGGMVPLTPPQRWFFEQNYPEPQQCCEVVLLEIKAPLEPALICQALESIEKQHTALYLRFVQVQHCWQQKHQHDKRAIAFTQIDLSACSSEVQGAAQTRTLLEVNQGMNLEHGPLLHMVLFQLGPSQPDRLLLAWHYLIADAFSLRILLEDFQNSYQQLVQGQQPRLPPCPISFQWWAQSLAAYAQSAEALQELPFWAYQRENEHLSQLPVDFSQDAPANTFASAATVHIQLDQEKTGELLRSMPAVAHNALQEILLTALVMEVTRWSGKQALLVELEYHGRIVDQMDQNLSRTVGRLAYRYPLLLSLPVAFNARSAFNAIREQLSQVPRNGIGYGLLSYLHSQPENAGQPWTPVQAALRFNYIGHLGQAFAQSTLFQPVSNGLGVAVPFPGLRPYLLEITAFLLDGALHILWEYSQHLHRSATIESLAQNYLASLHELITHCLTSPVPASISSLGLSQSELEALLNYLESSQGATDE